MRKNWEKNSSPHQNYRILPDCVIRIIVDFFWNPIAVVVSLNFHCFPIMSIFDKNLRFRINSNNNLWSLNNDFLKYSNQLCDPQIPPVGTVHYPHSLLCFPKWLLVNPFVSDGKIENYSFPIIQLYLLKWIHWIFFGLWLMFFLKWNMQQVIISEIHLTSLLSEWNRKRLNKSNISVFSHYNYKLEKNGNSIIAERLCIVSSFMIGLFICSVWKLNI